VVDFEHAGRTLVFMLSYRCYLLDQSDRITSYIALRAISDADAIGKPGNMRDWPASPFELWRGPQLICRETVLN
jgi:hypothetical protein